MRVRWQTELKPAKPLTSSKPKENELCILDLTWCVCVFYMNLNIMSTSHNITPSRHGKNMKILLATPNSFLNKMKMHETWHCCWCFVWVLLCFCCCFLFFSWYKRHEWNFGEFLTNWKWAISSGRVHCATIKIKHTVHRHNTIWFSVKIPTIIQIETEHAKLCRHRKSWQCKMARCLSRVAVVIICRCFCLIWYMFHKRQRI